MAYLLCPLEEQVRTTGASSISRRQNSGAKQLGLFDHANLLSESWPDPERFPFNHHGIRVESLVAEDLEHSRRPLLITGYASLERVLGFLARRYHRPDSYEDIRILFGHEPYKSDQPRPERGLNVEREMRDYWTEGFIQS